MKVDMVSSTFKSDGLRSQYLEKSIFTGLSGKSKAHLEHQNHLMVVIKSFTIAVSHSAWYDIARIQIRSSQKTISQKITFLPD